MPQSIFFFLGPKAISVAELGETGILVGIRIAGNEQVACESVKDVDSFCEAFLENYNLEELTDLEVSYLVIDAGALQEVRSRFFFHFRRCPRFSSLFLDQALPSVVLAKTEMGLSSSIDFSYKGKGYRLLTQDGLVKLESTELSSQEESLAIRDEDFSALVQPVAIQAKGHQRELRKSRETIAVLRAGLSELEQEGVAQMTELREELDILRKEMAEARQIAEAKYAQVCERLACLEQEKKELRRRLLLAEWHTGNYVKFAQYEWLILDRQGSRALLLSRHAVEKRRFDERSSNWEGSEIRSYLNGEFYASAFTAEERKRIIQTNEKDYVFLLSLNEALAYFKSDRARVCLLGGQAYWYWLRSTGDSSNRAAHILDVGSIKTYGLVYDSAGIRPAIWVNLDC